MERFGPLPGEPVAECERKASESDVVVCIVAHRYGFVPEKGRGSIITRREVEAAHQGGKAVLVWIVADDLPWTATKEQDRLTDPTVQADPERIAEVIEAVKELGSPAGVHAGARGAQAHRTPRRRRDEDVARPCELISIARKSLGSTDPPTEGEE